MIRTIDWKGYGRIMKVLNFTEKVERSEMDVKVEYMPSVISTSRPFQVFLIHLREHHSDGYDTRIFFL